MYIQAPENPATWSNFFARLFIGDVLSVLASYASIIGLGLTVYIAVSISKRSKSNYSFLRRAAEFERTLRRCTAALTNCGTDFSNSTQEIIVELGRADVTLRKLERLMRGDAKREVKETRAAIKSHEQDPTNEDKYRFAYSRLQRVIVEINEYKEDINME
jgi:hypothetical protein